jgi:hypothetical protein
MALNAGTMSSIMQSNLLAQVGVFYDDIADDHTLSGFTYADYLARFCNAVSQAIVTHIVGAARAQGLDFPGMNTHDLNIV